MAFWARRGLKVSSSLGVRSEVGTYTLLLLMSLLLLTSLAPWPCACCWDWYAE